MPDVGTGLCQEFRHFLAVEVVQHYVAFGFDVRRSSIVCIFVECCGSVASHFRPSDGTLLEEYLFIFLEDFYMGPASLKTSPHLGVPLVWKRVQALKREKHRTKKREKMGSLHLCGGCPFTA
jgi:hypothetical protein